MVPITLEKQRAIEALADRISQLDDLVEAYVEKRRSEIAENILKDERYLDLETRPRHLVATTAGARKTAREAEGKKKAEAILWLQQERTRRREEFDRVKASLAKAFTEKVGKPVPAAHEIVDGVERRFRSWPLQDVIELLTGLVREAIASDATDNRRRETRDAVRELLPTLQRYAETNEDPLAPLLVDRFGKPLVARVLDQFEVIRDLDRLGPTVVEELVQGPLTVHESLLVYLDDVDPTYRGSDPFRTAARLYGITLAQEDDQPPDPDAEIAKRIISWGRDADGNLITREEAEKDWVESHHKTREEEEREAFKEAERLVQEGRRVFHGGGNLFGNVENPLSTPMKRTRVPTGDE